MLPVKWTTAVSKLTDVAAGCRHMDSLPAGLAGFQAQEAWVFGRLLGPRQDSVEEPTAVRVAIVVDLPEDECAFLSWPQGGEHWLNASGLAKEPVHVLFRSAEAPVWNHLIDRPVRFWSREEGLDHEVLLQVRNGDGDALRPEAPTHEELRDRLDRDLRASVTALRRTTTAYDEKRWARANHKKLGDAMADAALGFLDLQQARDSLGS
jgi:hypothetical protein